MERRLFYLATLLLLGGCDATSRIAYVRERKVWTIPKQNGESSLWGASTETVVTDPMPIWKSGKPEYLIGHRGFVHMEAVLKDDKAVWMMAKPAKLDWVERGWWRMNPKLSFGESLRTQYDADNRYVGQERKPTGAFVWSGEMFRVPRNEFQPTSGWRVKQRKMLKREVPVVFSNPAMGGGGIQFQIPADYELDLNDVRLKPRVKYVAMMGEALDNPYSRWDVAKPVLETREKKLEFMQGVRMDPILLVEVEFVTLVEIETGSEKTVEMPTGWAIGAGRFHRDGLNR